MTPQRSVIIAWLVSLIVYTLAQAAPGATPASGLSLTTATKFQGSTGA